LSTGHVPDNFKTAYITPRLKKSNSDPADRSSYRPIPNLSVLSNLLERLVARRLLEHLEYWTRLASFHDCSLLSAPTTPLKRPC